MRSREEQIDDLAGQIWMAETSGSKAQKLAQHHIDEAIQRGRELERAEMGRDTERLDWIEHHRATQAVHLGRCGWHVLAEGREVGFSGDTFRSAIDTAMNAENGNG